jgi:hypothetical protein
MMPELLRLAFLVSNPATLAGCPHGGVTGAGGDWEKKHLSFADCSFLAGFAMTGSGYSAWEETSPAPSFDLHITVTGEAEGQITYRRDGAAGTVTIDGEYDGKPLRPAAD